MLVRLAFAHGRRRKLQATISIVVTAIAASALTVALSVGAIANRPWERTFAAMRGAHATVLTMGPSPRLGRVADLPGVTATTGVVPGAFTSFVFAGKRYDVRLAAPAPASPVERPVFVAGAFPKPGEVALERSFARAIGIEPGNVLIGPHQERLRVSGLAVLLRTGGYPAAQPGFGITRLSTLRVVAPDRGRWTESIGVRLADPAATDRFARLVFDELGGAVRLYTWQSERADAIDSVRSTRVVLAIFSVLLVLTAALVLATLVSGRVLAQAREVGILKSVGLTPGQIAQVTAFEQVLLAAVGAVIGIGAGLASAGRFLPDSAALLMTTLQPPFQLSRIVLVLGIVTGVAALAVTIAPLRAARAPAARLLSSYDRRPARRLSVFGALPVPLFVGLRDVLGRPARAGLAVAGLALTVSSLTATLAMEATVHAAAADHADIVGLRPVVYGLDAALLLLAATNLVACVVIGLRERVRELGLLKAVGLTPAQIGASFASAQALVAAGAVTLGVPLGLGLFRLGVAASGGGSLAYPALWKLALLAVAAPPFVVLLGAPAARRTAAIPVADALRVD